jgi:hypothetical protein
MANERTSLDACRLQILRGLIKLDTRNRDINVDWNLEGGPQQPGGLRFGSWAAVGDYIVEVCPDPDISSTALHSMLELLGCLIWTFRVPGSAEAS